MTWQAIPSTDGTYEASIHGEIRHTATKVVRPQNVGKQGYPVVSVRRFGANVTVHVHRLIAEAFLGEPAPRMQVNHKDLDKTNNCLSNLEYVTAKENIRHYHASGAKREPRPRAAPNNAPILAVNAITGVAMKYDNRGKAIAAGFTAAGISLCLAGRLRTHRGFKFQVAA
jgi:hypothetical protein